MEYTAEITVTYTYKNYVFEAESETDLVENVLPEEFPFSNYVPTKVRLKVSKAEPVYEYVEEPEAQ